MLDKSAFVGERNFYIITTQDTNIKKNIFHYSQL